MTRLPAARTATPLTVRPVGNDPARVAGLLVVAWTEVRDGQRPFHQLAPLLSPATQQRLSAMAPPNRTPRTRCPTRVRKVIARCPLPEVCEAVVLVEAEERVTAVAVRLERHLGRWRAVELTAPESGLTALSTASLPTGYRRRDAFDEAEEEARQRVAEA